MVFHFTIWYKHMKYSCRCIEYECYLYFVVLLLDINILFLISVKFNFLFFKDQWETHHWHGTLETLTTERVHVKNATPFYIHIFKHWQLSKNVFEDIFLDFEHINHKLFVPDGYHLVIIQDSSDYFYGNELIKYCTYLDIIIITWHIRHTPEWYDEKKKGMSNHQRMVSKSKIYSFFSPMTHLYRISWQWSTITNESILIFRMLYIVNRLFKDSWELSWTFNIFFLVLRRGNPSISIIMTFSS
jgi:hypothetical protein